MPGPLFSQMMDEIEGKSSSPTLPKFTDVWRQAEEAQSQQQMTHTNAQNSEEGRAEVSQQVKNLAKGSIAAIGATPGMVQEGIEQGGVGPLGMIGGIMKAIKTLKPDLDLPDEDEIKKAISDPDYTPPKGALKGGEH